MSHDISQGVVLQFEIFARIHKTLRITAPMACGLSDHVWSLEEIVMMADSYAPTPKPRGPFKKRSAEVRSL